jgi:23S rRNA pseudouridine1911/1915/1917 synthase
MRQFEEREVEKEYLAIVRGSPREDGGTITCDLGPAVHSQVRLKMAPVAHGLSSRTDWRVLERYDDCTLVACTLHTGRQHQIRVHMAAIGLPLVGDKLYGEDEELFLRAQNGELTPAERARLGLARHALHAHRLVVTSPTTGERIEITSPLPEDLTQYLAGRERIDG